MWQCAEVMTRRSFGFGRYQFQVKGPLNRLDPSVVFGLFDYPTSTMGPDGTNEIDIEYSRWGDPTNPLGNDTVCPAQSGLLPVTHPFAVPALGPNITLRFIRRSSGVLFQSLRGQRDDEQAYARWNFRPADSLPRVPQEATPVHINLWLFRGKPPQDGREVEVIVKRFSFVPSAP